MLHHASKTLVKNNCSNHDNRVKMSIVLLKHLIKKPETKACNLKITKNVLSSATI